MKTLATLLLITAPAFAALRPVDLRTEWLPNPIGVDAEKPRLSWRVSPDAGSQRGQFQSAYRIVVASNRDEMWKDHADLWDSGRVASSQTLNIEYAGKPLSSGQHVFWKVEMWDQNGKKGTSGAAEWVMGLLKPEDWKAHWIAFKDEAPLPIDRTKLHLPPPHTYRKIFSLKRPVKRAMLYWSALGIGDVFVDGRPAGGAAQNSEADYFAPGWSDYHERAYYRTHDVTQIVRNREFPAHPHTISAVVADGWYAGYVGYGLLVGYGPNRSGRNIYGKTPALLAQLEITYDDGSHEIIGTDETWQVTEDGPYREADLLMGEVFDARRASPLLGGAPVADKDPAEVWKWDFAILAENNGRVKATFFDTRGPREVELGFQKPKRMAAYPAPPVRVVESLPVKDIRLLKPGVWIFDFGVNVAGDILFTPPSMPAGTKITFRYGEMLHTDGSLMTENLRRARATDTYFAGRDPLPWSPRFTYHGFRYVEVTGLPVKPDLGTLRCNVIRSETKFGSNFECSDRIMTQFRMNTVWTQGANFLEVPTDCPQRDERLGWMGDAQIYARTATYNADVAAFFTKWLADVREAQQPDGAYPDYAPFPYSHGAPGAVGAAAWSDAGVLVPDTMWRVYGDRRLVEQQWDSMEKYMAWRLAKDPALKGVKAGNTWGDWLNVNEATPIEFIDLCYHARCCACMKEMAEALGKSTAASTYGERFLKLQASFVQQFTGPDEMLNIHTQTACVLALWSKVADAPHTGIREKAVSALVGRLQSNDYRMATGFLGTKSLLSVLTENGQHDLACRLFQSRKFPSWGYEVEQGATSVWERWDSFTKEHGFEGAHGGNNAAMNSFSHYAFGAVMEWAFRDLAGVDNAPLWPGESGPDNGAEPKEPLPVWTIQPHVASRTSNPDGQSLDRVSAAVMHPLGTVQVAWRRTGEQLFITVVIPPNTVANFIPPAGVMDLTEKAIPILQAKSVREITQPGGPRTFRLGAGSYSFIMREGGSK